MQAHLVCMAKSNTSRTGSLVKHSDFCQNVLDEGLFQHHPHVCGAEKNFSESILETLNRAEPVILCLITVNSIFCQPKEANDGFI